MQDRYKILAFKREFAKFAFLILSRVEATGITSSRDRHTLPSRIMRRRILRRYCRRVRNFTRPSGYIEYFINERRSLNSEGTWRLACTYTFLSGFHRMSRPPGTTSIPSVTHVPKGRGRIKTPLLPFAMATTIRMLGAGRDITSRTCYAAVICLGPLLNGSRVLDVARK